MNKLLTSVAVVALSTSLITGCSTNTQNQNTAAGAMGGAVVGGVAAGALGASPVGIGLSAVAGALVGGYIGHSMDSSDTTAMSNAMNTNATNMPSHWTNPNTGVVYKIVPTSNMMTVNGNPNCRSYRASAIIKGKKHVSYGVACRQSNGTWLTMKK